MDEEAYKAAREEINPLACPFEKAILFRCCNCELASRKNIAERETVSCRSAVARENCHTLREHLRANALFALGLTHSGPLPHGKEIKVQCGGLIGLQRALHPDRDAPVENVHALMLSAQQEFDSLEDFPYSEIIQSIAAYESRRKR